MKKFPLLLILTCLVVFTFTSCIKEDDNDPNVKAARGLVNRLLPDYSKYFVFEKLTSDTTSDSIMDRFELESRGKKIIIRGNNASSMAVGLNHYLKYYCKAQVSWFKEDSINMPAKLVKIPEKVSINARVKQRFFLNYCTYGYTMPWWGWADWEHFIDWMALNGINLPLAITGQESVWYKVWTSLGLSDEDVRNYFTGPAHLPWHRMQNIDHWGGPLPITWLENQEALQKQIVERERQFNMKPVLPGFAGHVPTEITKIYPNVKLSSLGDWGGFEPICWCNFLDPMDSLYSVIQKKFIDEETKLYGTDHIYGLDLFNEMTPPDSNPEYLGRVSRQVYESLKAADPDAVWLQMTWLFFNERDFWTNNKVQPYITSLPKNKQILLDYYCEKMEVWQRTEKYFGVPYIWCYLGNFGGNTMLAGNIQEVNKRIENTFANGGKNFVGIGSTLEGFDCNPFMYEYVFEKAWDFDIHKDVAKWTEALADQRAGKEDENMRAGWKLLIDSVYNWPTTCGQCSMINGRPTLNMYQYYVNPTYKYNNINLLNVLDKFLAAKTTTRAHSFDVVNVTRQLLGNYFSDLYKDFVREYNNRNFDSLAVTEKTMLEIIDDCDRILASDNTFLLGRWIDEARAIGKTDEEKNYFESNARNLITTWGPKDNLLNDYGSRTWAGLTDSFYGERWSRFFDEINASIGANKTFNEKQYRDEITTFEEQWGQQRVGTFKSTPEGDPVAIAKEIVNKYRGQLEERY